MPRFQFQRGLTSDRTDCPIGLTSNARSTVNGGTCNLVGRGRTLLRDDLTGGGIRPFANPLLSAKRGEIEAELCVFYRRGVIGSVL